MSDFEVFFLTRPGCHLCDQARPMVQTAAQDAGVSVTEVDIDSDEKLLVLYDLRVPVLLGPGDEVIAEGIIDSEPKLRRALRRLRRRQPD